MNIMFSFKTTKKGNIFLISVMILGISTMFCLLLLQNYQQKMDMLNLLDENYSTEIRARLKK